MTKTCHFYQTRSGGEYEDGCDNKLRRVECQLYDYDCTFYLPVTIKPSPIAELFYGSRASDFDLIEDLRWMTAKFYCVTRLDYLRIVTAF